MRLVFDSTTLIYFAKLRILQLLGKMKGEKIIPFFVHKEVVEKGIKKGKEDAYFIDGLIKQDVFVVEKCRNEFFKKISEIRNLSMADAETLALAKEKRSVAVIDESILRSVAQTYNVEYRELIFLLFQLYHEKAIKKIEIKKYLDEMIKLGWRCSTELYVSILQEIEKL